MKPADKREIKFRQRNSNEWHYWGFINGGFVAPVSPDTDKYPNYQYVGLKDRNGTDIFEGDLIQVGHMVYQISWYAMDARLMPFTTETIKTNQYMSSAGVPIRNWNWLDGGKAIYFHEIKKSVEVEVIGNVWKNPELLNSK